MNQYKNKNMKSVIYFWIGMVLLMVTSCVQPPEWLKVENETPSNVSNVTVDPIFGGAIVRYTTPQERGLLGVKVAYTLTNGEFRERFSSVGVDSVLLEGFGDTNEYQATIYTVHQSGNLSSGLPVTIQPLEPVLVNIRQTLQTENVFGGIALNWENPLEQQIRVSLYWFNPERMEWVLFNNYFSSGKNGRVVSRPFTAERHQFRVEMYDRWMNSVEPFEFEGNPWPEYELASKENDRYLWGIYDEMFVTWRGDISNFVYPRPFTLALDGRLPHENSALMWQPGDDGANMLEYTGDNVTMPWPLYFTVDFGREQIFSRINFRSANYTYVPIFYAWHPSDFEIWGANHIKPREEIGDKNANLAYWTEWEMVGGTDQWKSDGWTRISTNKLLFSDGTYAKYAANLDLSLEDLNKYNYDGFDHDINEDSSNPYRYLRFVIHDITNSNKILTICGFRAWGLYADEIE